MASSTTSERQKFPKLLIIQLSGGALRLNSLLRVASYDASRSCSKLTNILLQFGRNRFFGLRLPSIRKIYFVPMRSVKYCLAAGLVVTIAHPI